MDVLNSYSDIFNQAKKNKRKTSLAYRTIERLISQHRFTALKSSGYIRQWNNYQANFLEKKLEEVIK